MAVNFGNCVSVLSGYIADLVCRHAYTGTSCVLEMKVVLIVQKPRDACEDIACVVSDTCAFLLISH